MIIFKGTHTHTQKYIYVWNLILSLGDGRQSKEETCKHAENSSQRSLKLLASPT